MRPKTMDKRDFFELCTWLKTYGVTDNKTHTAKLASEALGFFINPADIGSAADAVGLVISSRTYKKPYEVFARELIRIERELGMIVPDELIRISQKKGA
jgi:hypothetical protein